ncbi:MAG: cyclopropane-fatty-acyl-phospholipid synthase family protein [Bryobacteraceae bacterium]
MNLSIRLAESGIVPDWLIRAGIHRLLRQRLREERCGDAATAEERRRRFLNLLRDGPIAVETSAANEQHYEVPPEFFLHALGRRLKYSCCLFASGNEDLDEAEEAMLGLTCKRAQVQDGMDLLELGCGWGSLTLWMAERCPRARITAVSNSRPQREFILARCRERGFGNVTVITADMNDFTTDLRFDRILSVEMFEHMRNYQVLLGKVASWMRPDGRLFVHVFCHREFAYAFETGGPGDWMGRMFFTGGIMPSYDLLLCFQDDVAIENHWRVSGIHYQRTAECWLRNMDNRRGRIMPVLEAAYGRRDAGLWFRRWRIFFMACAELWGFRGGEEWLVAHYLFRRKPG